MLPLAVLGEVGTLWKNIMIVLCKQVNPGAEEDRVGEIMGREG